MNWDSKTTQIFDAPKRKIAPLLHMTLPLRLRRNFTPMFIAKTPRLLPFLLCSLALMAPSARSADFIWSAPQQITGNGDVSTLGTLIGAFNVGDTGVPSTSVNGVTFVSFAAPGGNGTVGGFTLTSSGGTFASNSGSGSSEPPFSSLSPEYQTLLMSRVAMVFGTFSMTMTGLIVGQEYQFQAWVNDSSGEFGYETVFVTGMTSVTLSGNTGGAPGGLGELVTATFVADSTSQVINFNWSEVGFLNAFQLRAIPEPGTTALLAAAGLGLLAMTLRRRRRF